MSLRALSIAAAFCALGLLSPFAFGLSPAEGSGASRPNLLLIIADDCTYRDTEVYGGQAKTPNMKRLAQEGMKFTRCFQAAPMCSPTRHALYTSLYPVKSGAYPNHTYIKEGVTSVAHWLKAAGYRVALSGKTHIAPKASFPFEYSMKRELRSTSPDFDAVDTLLAECAASRTPFGLIVASNEPHAPWQHGDKSAYPPAKIQLPPIYPDTDETRQALSAYFAEITFFDAQVGRALALLKKHNLDDNTLVVVITEQGNSLPFAKWTCYDVGVSSGLIVRFPGKVAPGSSSSALVEYIDIMPTFLEAAGIKPPAGLDGRSFLPVLTDKSATHKDVVFALQTTRGIAQGAEFYGIRTARDSRYRYILNFTPDATFKNAATGPKDPIWKSWKTAATAGDSFAARQVKNYQHRPAEELYDCESDPWNLTNLIDDPALAETKSRLKARLADWMKSQGDLGQATEMNALNHLAKNIGESNAD